MKRLLPAILLLFCYLVGLPANNLPAALYTHPADTIPAPWNRIELTGGDTKPGLLLVQPTRKSPVLPIVGGAVLGGGAVWLLTRERGTDARPIANDDALTIPCGQNSATLNVLANDQGEDLEVVSVNEPAGVNVSIAAAGTLVITGLGPQSFTFSYTVEDQSGNRASAQVSISISDNEAPALFCPADINITCEQNTDPATTGMATAEDACAGAQLSLNYTDDGSGLTGCGNTGNLIRTWTSTDPAGNSSQCVQVITILTDETAPEITCPATASALCAAMASPDITGFAQGNDNCTASLTFQYEDDPAGLTGCGGTGTLLRTFTATDACGNTSSCTQTIQILGEKPTISCPEAITISCQQEPDPALTGTAAAGELQCPGPLELHYEDDPTGLTGCGGTGELIRTWTVADTCGLMASCTQMITLVDETPPNLTCPTDTTALCSGTPAPDPTLTGFPEGEDNCSSSLNYDFEDDASGVTNCEGALLRIWTATDECGNSSQCEQKITLMPGAAPEVTCPGPTTVECSVVPDPALTGSASATFFCGDPTAGTLVYEDDPSGLTGCNGTGTLLRTWTATDECGNATACTQSIVIADDTPPVLTCPANAEAVCMEPNDPSITGMAQAVDNCSSAPGIVYEDDDSGVMNCAGVLVRTWTATDDCGNASACAQLISILPPPCTFTATFSVANADCGLANGVAVANVSPAGNYSYQWSNGTTGLVLSDVPAGNYQVTITDVPLSCNLVFEVVVGQNPPQYVQNLTVVPADCPGGGDISFVVSGGQGPFTVTVNGPAGTNTLSNVPNGTEVHLNTFMPVLPGNYTLEVNDQGAGPQCTEVVTVNVTQAPPYALQVLQVNPPSSPSAADGSIQLQVLDPAAHPPPYQIILNGAFVGFANNPIFTIQNLPAGIYDIMVLDAAECPSQTVTVELMPMFHFEYVPSVNPEGLNLSWPGGDPEHPAPHTFTLTDVVLARGAAFSVYRHKTGGNFIGFGLVQAEGWALAKNAAGPWQGVSLHLLQPKLMAGHLFRFPKGSLRLSAGVYARYVALGHPDWHPLTSVRMGFSLDSRFEMPFGKCGLFSLPLTVFPFGKQGARMGFEPALYWRF